MSSSHISEKYIPRVVLHRCISVKRAYIFKGIYKEIFLCQESFYLKRYTSAKAA